MFISDKPLLKAKATFVDHTAIGLDEVTRTAIQQPEQPDITLVKSNKSKDVHNGIEGVTNSKVVSCEPENRGNHYTLCYHGKHLIWLEIYTPHQKFNC